jgi:TonB-dependent starch-binding outer membrane protein SusC
MKKTKRLLMHRCLPAILVLFVSLQVFAQSRTVTGKVTGSTDKQPLPGVTVQVKGTNTTTTTDPAGNFSIAVPNAQSVLVFSFAGMRSIERSVGDAATIDVELESTGSLGEVVVIGYGTARKSDLTGSVGAVKAQQLQERPAPSLNQAISGRVPGVFVNTNSGRPGGQTTVRIRGFSSINSTLNPLYVVDGVQLPMGTQTQFSNSIDFINPNDIASVDILKDASATAIYGARGANGVIIITTKRGNSNVGRVTYDADFSVNTLGPQRVEMLNAQEYIEVENKAYDNIKVYDPAGWAAGNYNTVVDPRVKRQGLPLLFDANGNPLYNTDWLKEATQTKLSQNHQIGFSGGNADNNYGIFLGYRDDQGLLLNSYLKRFSGRFSLDSKLKDWLKVGGSLGYYNQQENIVDQGTGGLNSVRMITEAFPFLPVKYPDGSWGDNNTYPGAEGGANPVHILTDRKFILNTQTVLGNTYVNINITKDLEFRSVLGVNVVTRGANQYSGRTLNQISQDQRGTASVSNGRESFWSTENYFTYNKKISNDHQINATLGLSWQETNIFNISASSQNFSSDAFQFYNIGVGAQQNPGGSGAARFSLNSYFARANYTFRGKYLVTVTGRADASSKFGANNQYGFFPSAALAWRVSEEDFLKNSDFISNLKIRASYGQTGNSEIATYSKLARLGNYTAVLDNVRTGGVGVGGLGNDNLKWEKTATTDFGVELGLFNGRLNLEADIYYRKTTDMLLNAPLPTTSGRGSVTRNIGSLENRGLELAINGEIFRGEDFSWSSTLNASFNKNKVLSLATPADIFGVGGPNFTNPTNIIRVGEPVGSFWGLVRLGVWTAAEAAEAAKFSAASYRGGKPILPGDIKYLDVNGDYQINDLDRQIIGNGNPDVWGGFFNTFRYKRFELLVELQYQFGNDILDMTTHSGEDRQGIANSFRTVLNAYDPSKGIENAEIAAIRDTRAGYVTNVDTRWIQDGSFVRGKNLLLGYNFPAATFQKFNLSRLRVYASVQNFFLSTKYRGNDPEVTTYGNAFAQGQAFFDYPKPTTYMLGLNVAF